MTEQLNKAINEIQRIADAQSRPEFWYDKKWIIALFGAFVGVLAVALLDFIREKIRKREYIGKMVKNLFSEIIIARDSNNRLLPDNKNNLKEFIAMLNGEFDGKPSIAHFDTRTKDYYQIYLKDLGLLNDFLRMKIITFYAYLGSVDAGSKKLEIMFKKFYDPKDKMIGKEDILKVYGQMIRQMEIIDLLGAEALAEMINFYKVDKPIDDKNFKEKEKQILDSLEKIRVNEIVNTKEIAEKTKASLIMVNITLLKIEGMKNIKYGEYKKMVGRRKRAEKSSR